MSPDAGKEVTLSDAEVRRLFSQWRARDIIQPQPAAADEQPPTNTPANKPTDTPADTPTDTPTDTPADAPAASPADAPADTPAATDAESPPSAELGEQTEFVDRQLQQAHAYLQEKLTKAAK